MTDNNSFSISRKGYNCAEVEEYLNAAHQSEVQLRESYASLQEKYDALYEENSKMRKDCTALAIALQKLRETSVTQESNNNSEEIAALKAEKEALEAEKEALEAELAAIREKDVDAASSYGDAASKMIAEVAQVVQKLEKDAQRKADAITAAARLEQEKARLIKEQVNHEVHSLMSMLESFIGNTAIEEIPEAVKETIEPLQEDSVGATVEVISEEETE